MVDMHAEGWDQPAQKSVAIIAEKSGHRKSLRCLMRPPAAAIREKSKAEPFRRRFSPSLD